MDITCPRIALGSTMNQKNHLNEGCNMKRTIIAALLFTGFLSQAHAGLGKGPCKNPGCKNGSYHKLRGFALSNDPFLLHFYFRVIHDQGNDQRQHENDG